MRKIKEIDDTQRMQRWKLTIKANEDGKSLSKGARFPGHVNSKRFLFSNFPAKTFQQPMHSLRRWKSLNPAPPRPPTRVTCFADIPRKKCVHQNAPTYLSNKSFILEMKRWNEGLFSRLKRSTKVLFVSVLRYEKIYSRRKCLQESLIHIYLKPYTQIMPKNEAIYAWNCSV